MKLPRYEIHVAEPASRAFANRIALQALQKQQQTLDGVQLNLTKAMTDTAAQLQDGLSAEVAKVLEQLDGVRSAHNERCDAMEKRMFEVKQEVIDYLNHEIWDGELGKMPGRMGKVEEDLIKLRAEVDERFAEVHEKLGELNVRMTEQEVKSAEHEVRLEDHESQLFAIKERMEEMDARITDNYNELKAQIEEVETRLASKIEKVHAELTAALADFKAEVMEMKAMLQQAIADEAAERNKQRDEDLAAQNCRFIAMQKETADNLETAVTKMREEMIAMEQEAIRREEAREAERLAAEAKRREEEEERRAEEERLRLEREAEVELKRQAEKEALAAAQAEEAAKLKAEMAAKIKAQEESAAAKHEEMEKARQDEMAAHAQAQEDARAKEQEDAKAVAAESGNDLESVRNKLIEVSKDVVTIKTEVVEMHESVETKFTAIAESVETLETRTTEIVTKAREEKKIQAEVELVQMEKEQQAVAAGGDVTALQKQVEALQEKLMSELNARMEEMNARCESVTDAQKLTEAGLAKSDGEAVAVKQEMATQQGLVNLLKKAVDENTEGRHQLQDWSETTEELVKDHTTSLDHLSHDLEGKADEEKTAVSLSKMVDMCNGLDVRKMEISDATRQVNGVRIMLLCSFLLTGFSCCVSARACDGDTEQNSQRGQDQEDAVHRHRAVRGRKGETA
jgi:hypothetical protein